MVMALTVLEFQQEHIGCWYYIKVSLVLTIIHILPNQFS